MKVEDVARLIHEVNRVICRFNGEEDVGSWDEVPEEIRNSAVDGVYFHLANPDVTPEQSHENWMTFKISNGWEYGPAKDLEKKTHPCLVPYENLPANQRIKDYIFKTIVDNVRDLVDTPA